jgi:hypothetical protein
MPVIQISSTEGIVSGSPPPIAEVSPSDTTSFTNDAASSLHDVTSSYHDVTSSLHDVTSSLHDVTSSLQAAILPEDGVIQSDTDVFHQEGTFPEQDAIQDSRINLISSAMTHEQSTMADEPFDVTTIASTWGLKPIELHFTITGIDRKSVV